MELLASNLRGRVDSAAEQRLTAAAESASKKRSECSMLISLQRLVCYGWTDVGDRSRAAPPCFEDLARFRVWNSGIDSGLAT